MNRLPRMHRRWAVALLALAMLLWFHADASALDPGCEEGEHAEGAGYLICMPATWNGALIIYAYGYVSPTRPVEIPPEQLRPDGSPVSINQFVTDQGYAFAASDYGSNGLSVLSGLAHIEDLVGTFTARKGEPSQVLLLGVSEGGLTTALALERRPDLYAGGLALCGPYGDFATQTRYLGDARVVFDYYFPDLIPGSPVDIPQTLVDTWETGFYTDTVQPVITAPENAAKVTAVLTVAGVAFDADDVEGQIDALETLLWYNVVGTNDARAKLGGQPFDNQTRVYTGSADDEALNAGIARFTADAAATETMAGPYASSGKLPVPLVTMHTLHDATVPYAQATIYGDKVVAMNRSAFYEHIPIDATGHCAFGLFDLLNAFTAIRSAVADPPAVPQEAYLPLAAR